ncbi:MAG: 3D domain-containing protein [Myxococcota bacterium]|nr:3D domain-containing protein [Myxococcota bacterium]
MSDLVAQLVHGVQAVVLAPLVLAMGCQSGTVDASIATPPPEVVVPAVAAVDDGPRKLGLFSITFYYVIREDEVAPKQARRPAPTGSDSEPDDDADEGDDRHRGGGTELAAIAPPPPDLTLLYGPKGCEPIAEVSRAFAHQLRIQGTGKLRDGRVLNVWGHCSCPGSVCYKEITQQWGTAGNGRPLQPFRTVAVDPKLIKLGSLLYVPLLEGRTMPGRAPWGGFVHDGCVVADDTGGGIKDRQLDLFVGRKGWFLGMSGLRGSHSWAKHAPVFDGAKLCERKGRRVARKSGAI